jgi:hypothetical protein
MSLNEEIVVNKIEIIETEDGVFVQVRSTVREFDGDTLIGQSHHRNVISAGDDYSSEPANVQAACSTAFGD